MLTKIFGYYLLIFLLCRYGSLIRIYLKKKDIGDKCAGIVSMSLIYVPMTWFVVDRLVQLGFKL